MFFGLQFKKANFPNLYQKLLEEKPKALSKYRNSQNKTIMRCSLDLGMLYMSKANIFIININIKSNSNSYLTFLNSKKDGHVSVSNNINLNGFWH